MEISRIRTLRGPNLWSRHTSVEAVVTCDETELSIANLPGFETRLRERFPALGMFEPQSIDETISLAHVLETTTLWLQAQAGCPVTFSRTTPTPDAGVYQVVVEYSQEEVGHLAFELADKLIQSALNDQPFDCPAALKQIRELDEDIRLGPSTGSIVDAAVMRGIPYRRLTSGSLVQFGWGSKQRRIQAAETDRSSAIAESIAQDKELTKKLLHAGGVPVPMGRPVMDADDAWAAAQEVGVPVVVKPLDGNQGKGVSVNLHTREQVFAGYEFARSFRRNIMVERYLPGHDFRMLVVGDKLVAAARREPPYVVGDGERTIKQLVDIVNLDPQRGDGHATSLTKIRLDEIAIGILTKQDLTVDSVPAKGVRVILRNNANLSTGGTATDVTDDVHPDVAARAVEAARMIGLDVCGIDALAETLQRPMEEQNGGVVEVNAAPGLRMHLAPSFGKGRDVGKAIIDSMFGESEDGRIPVVAVTGTNGKTTTVRLTAHILTTNGLRTGMTNTDGIYVQGQRIDTGDCSGPRSARNVLMHPDVDAAVFETARGGMLREGLGFDRCDVAIVTNIGMGDHLGLNYINTVEDLAKVKQIIVRNVAPTGMAVLNGADPHTVRMAAVCPGAITYFAAELNAVMAEHMAQGGRVIYRDGDFLLAREGKFEMRLPLAEMPLTMNGTIPFQVDNAMAAIGAGWALGIKWGVIMEAIGSFETDSATAPGRFNLFSYKGATIVADYGHNPDAIAALAQALAVMPAKKRAIVISGAGDRRDEDIMMQGQIVGQNFDDVMLYEDACQRGRKDGEVIGLFRKGLEGAPRASYIEEVRGEFLAIDKALARLQAGDLCLILVDQVEEALAHIAKRVSEAA
ncbi:MAG TPA: cyanophycin synthetase [Rhodocyclaceae bacterium]|jgi:cyanophycin synthetase|nr:cyanophycin synthetase [Rhodocyclaceae bacterium]